MQATQILNYPIQFILMKCRDCIQRVLNAWRSMFNRRPINMYNYVPPGGARRPMPRSQRTKLNPNRSVPTNIQNLPRGVPRKRPASPQKVVQKTYYRPAVIPLKWYKEGAGTTPSDNLVELEKTTLAVTEQAPQVSQNEMEAKSPKYEGRKKWQKPVGHRSAIREDKNVQIGVKYAPKETKRAPFVNKRWSY